ncbi:MAG: ATP-dependent sacrificial sulfur transferase LarE [Acidobacteriota bacterium]
MNALEEKVARLRAILEQFREGALVAFSGGADSALLLVEAAGVLGERCMGVTADSPTLPRDELEAAVVFARRRGIRHQVVQTREMDNPAFVANDTFRCYHCKSELFARMEELASGQGLSWLLFGAIADDVGDWRPGMKAAEERGMRAPLMEAGLTKAEVRERSKQLGLETWDKPAAACLSSRFPAGRPILLGDLSRVERAEQFLKAHGLRQARVRLLDDAARIEVEEEGMNQLLEPAFRAALCRHMKELGFRFITLDLEGFRSGSLSHGPLEERHV